MKTDLLQHELTRTSAIFGRKHDVRVRFHGSAALTDGNTIILPSLAFGVEVDDDLAAVMRGYVDHEAGHVRHTDFAGVRPLREKARLAGDTLTARIGNALEDIWLERRVIGEYPGAEANLRATTTHVNRRSSSRSRRERFPPPPSASRWPSPPWPSPGRGGSPTAGRPRPSALR
jgi:hypothetical protein